MNVWQAQHAFWAAFGVPAYEENSVPDADEVSFPYITYEAVSGGFGSDCLVSASIWTKSTSWLAAVTLADAIHARLGGRDGGGAVVPYDGGGIWITPEDTFAQNMGDDEEDLIKRKIISVVLRFI